MVDQLISSAIFHSMFLTEQHIFAIPRNTDRILYRLGEHSYTSLRSASDCSLCNCRFESMSAEFVT